MSESLARTGMAATAGYLEGHEWLGGAAAFREVHSPTASPPPQRNASLLLLGVVSGSRNFDARWWVRRAFWAQRPWLLGVDWRFVVGTTVPRGDNDRLSLHYEANRYGDVDLVHGSEMPPKQAYTPLLWWVHAASRHASRPGAPAFFGVSSDSVLLSLPRLAVRLLPLLPARKQRDLHFAYAGDMRWGAWDDRAVLPWACVGAAFHVGQASWCSERRRIVGDCPPPADALSQRARDRVAAVQASSGACGADASSVFLAASPELQVLSGPLLLRVAAQLRMAGQRLEVFPPMPLWEGSLKYHQSAAGRTPFHPALLAATALARAVHNASSGGLAVTYLRLRTGRNRHVAAWDSNTSAAPEGRFLLVRRVDDSLKAEAALWRMQLWRAVTPQPRLRCPRQRCADWGVAEASVTCCD